MLMQHRYLIVGVEDLVVMEMMLEKPTSHCTEVELVSDEHERRPSQIVFKTRRDEREREKCLQNRVGELQSQTEKLGRRILMLKTENYILKKKQADQKPLEEKVRELRKRNAELVAIARRLEEKAKSLQLENSRSKSTLFEGGAETAILKRCYARQRAKDLADHAKNVLEKDKDIEKLKSKCQNLVEALNREQLSVAASIKAHEQEDDLVDIIKMAAKERLQLEQQLADSEAKLKDNRECEILKEELGAANEILHSELEKAEQTLKNSHLVSIELCSKVAELEAVKQEVLRLATENQRLRQEQTTAVSRSAEVAVVLSRLSEKVKNFDKVSEESNRLQETLAAVQRERDCAWDLASVLQAQISHLEGQVETQAQVFEHKKVADDLRARIKKLEAQCKSPELTQCQIRDELRMIYKQGDELQKTFLLQRPDINVAKLQNSENRHYVSPPSSGGIPTSDSVDSGFPASGANSDEGAAGFISELCNHASTKPATLTSSCGITSTSDWKETGVMDKKGTDLEHYKTTQRPDKGCKPASHSKGPITVFVAKYSYDPFRLSPNENPEAELPLTVGDHILVQGDMDEDGFYEGELTNGTRGLVPSNFIELLEAQAAPMSTTFQRTDIMVDANNGMMMGDVSNTDNNSHSVVPFPHSLLLERQLSSSVVVSWQQPHITSQDGVEAYLVLVDGQCRHTLKGSQRTKALLEDVDCSQVHRVSVLCDTVAGRSRDSQCCMIIGRGAVPAPSELTVCDVATTSCRVVWLPGNSSFTHAVFLNGRQMSVVQPGTCFYTLTGLTLGAVHRVKVVARPTVDLIDRRQQWTEDQLSCQVEFETLTGPDPPLSVQVESGPREGTILLTWLPAASSTSDVSMGTDVIGHVVYADGERIKHTIGASTDHLVLCGEDFMGRTPLGLTVRSTTIGQQESCDSQPAQLSQPILDELFFGMAHHRHGDADKQQVESLKGSPLGKNNMDQITESSNSELSDILEVEEEMVGEETNMNGDCSLAEMHNQVALASKRLKASKRRVSSSDTETASEKGDIGEMLQPSGGEMEEGVTRRLPRQTVLPAIEITKDSSTEHGTSLEEEEGAGSRHFSSSPQLGDSHSYHGKGQRSNAHGSQTRQHRQSAADYLSGIDSTKEHLSRKTDGQWDELSDGGGVLLENGYHPSKDASVDRPPNSPVRIRRSVPGQTEDDADYPQVGLCDRAPPKPVRTSPIDPWRMSAVLPTAGDSDGGGGDDCHERLFVALFNYDPETMSPNIDSVEEELPLLEGQILRVYGDKDEDGFFYGEAKGRSGFIPCNMVSEIHIDDPDLVSQLLEEAQIVSLPSLTDKRDTSICRLAANGETSPTENLTVCRMVAMFDYDPKELSPNVDAEVELPFKQGDIVHVVGAMDNDGFYMAEINGSRGLVPSNFLQIVSSSSIHTPDPVGDESKAVTHSRTKHSSHKDSLKSVTMNHGVGEEVSGKLQPNALHVAISPLTGAGAKDRKYCNPGRKSP